MPPKSGTRELKLPQLFSNHNILISAIYSSILRPKLLIETCEDYNCDKKTYFIMLNVRTLINDSVFL